MKCRQMEEKTEKLRDIFLSVSDEERVTESQTERPGSLTDDGASAGQRLADVLDGLREKFGFETPLSDDERLTLIRGFYDGRSDDELAAELDCEASTVFAARMELHLLRDSEPPLSDDDLETVRANPDVGARALADRLGADERAVRRSRAALQAEDRSRRASQRFRTAYREILTDQDLTDQFATETQDDGLEDATDGAETDVEF